VEIVELAPPVLRGAEYFRHVNFDVLGRPNVHLRLDDGRNHLLLTNRKYDLITADIVRPWQAGSGSLYSAEYFRLAAAALAPGGLMSQWIHADGDTEYKLILRTFLAVFPHVSLWYDGQLLIGSNQPHAFDPTLVARKLATPQTGAALAGGGAAPPADILTWYLASTDALRRFAGPGPLITDNSPYVEYFRSLPRDDPPPSLDPLRGADPAEITRP
jgi:spermidine synthase